MLDISHGDYSETGWYDLTGRFIKSKNQHYILKQEFDKNPVWKKPLINKLAKQLDLTKK